ncbi:beta-mannosidase [Marinilabiliaceae bacterium A049]|nr:beta-mannosidase [Marinilabiliaceae bacterium A049]
MCFNKIYCLFLMVVITTVACDDQSEEKTGRQELIERLQSIKGKGILFGHQDDLAYGINWKYVDGQSDVKRVAGDYPALFGWELGGLERGDACNLDSVPFDVMRSLAIKASQNGGINTFSWHPYSLINGENSWNTDTTVVKYIIPGGEYHNEFIRQLDKLAVFLNSFQMEDGKKMPFIFRPWHEMDGSWFWWGSKHCTSDEFKALFRFTIDYLKNEKGMDQMAIAYSPDCSFNSLNEYLTWYPGDEYVDIVGMDNYYDLRVGGDVDAAIKKLQIVVGYTNQKGKISALTESGIENVADTTWYTQKLGVVLKDSLVAANLSYTMVWRNDPDVHFFFPYPGHPGAVYAKEFLDQDHIWLLNDLVESEK